MALANSLLCAVPPQLPHAKHPDSLGLAALPTAAGSPWAGPPAPAPTTGTGNAAGHVQRAPLAEIPAACFSRGTCSSTGHKKGLCPQAALALLAAAEAVGFDSPTLSTPPSTVGAYATPCLSPSCPSQDEGLHITGRTVAVSWSCDGICALGRLPAAGDDSQLRARAAAFAASVQQSSLAHSALLALGEARRHPATEGGECGLEWTLAQMLALHLRAGSREGALCCTALADLRASLV